jgi:hypothetical protein
MPKRKVELRDMNWTKKKGNFITSESAGKTYFTTHYKVTSTFDIIPVSLPEDS